MIVAKFPCVTVIVDNKNEQIGLAVVTNDRAISATD
jgi:hypothetical protein